MSVFILYGVCLRFDQYPSEYLEVISINSPISYAFQDVIQIILGRDHFSGGAETGVIRYSSAYEAHAEHIYRTQVNRHW